MAPPRRPPSALSPAIDPARANVLGAESPLGRERGVILAVDAQRHAYRVITASGRTLVVGRLRTGPGDSSLIPVHTPVRIDYSLGQPYIDGILPVEVPLQGEQNANATGADGHGGADTVLNRNLGASFRAPGEPSDLIPGDQALRSPDGAMVAALHGKVSTLFGSPMAQMRVFGAADAAEIIAGTLRLITWMGESKYINDDGKTSFVWRGGSDQLTETGADEERYTLRLDVGHQGDLFKFEVTTPDGQPVFRLHVDPRGKVNILAADGLNAIVGREENSRCVSQVQGERVTITEGPSNERVSGDAVSTYQGSYRLTVSGQNSAIYLQDDVLRVNRNRDVSIGSREVRNVGGNRTTTIVGDDELNARNSYRLTTINYVTTVTGEASFSAPRMHLDTPTLRVGRNPTAHAVKYEALNDVLRAMNADITELKAQLRAHTHPVVLGPTPTATPSTTLLTLRGFTLNLGSAKSLVMTLE